MKCTCSSNRWWINSLFITLFVFNGSVVAQQNQWTWMSGSDSPYQGNVYGMKGIGAPGNVPGGRWGGQTWTDDSGNLWLFGGDEVDTDAEPQDRRRNDLWKYNTATGKWAWMSGDSTINQSPVYGIQGVPNAKNKPGARAGSEQWKDKEGNLWLFGGGGYVAGTYGDENDLWMYNIATGQWTWVAGDTVLNVSGVYGTKGVASPGNKPGSRVSGVSWTDNDGNLWLFGGLGYASEDHGWLSDLWKYNITTNEWTWMSGNTTANVGGVYGAKGIADPGNKPGGRGALIGSADMDGNFWLLGGFAYATDDNAGWMNDLWKYDPATNSWTWVSGDDTPNQPGVYGIQGVPDAANKPGGRSSSSAFVGKAGVFWVFGGFDASAGGVINDLWKYEPATNLWTWMSGDQVGWQDGVYGIKGMADPANKPGAREEPFPWTDKDGNLWLFGGRYSSGAYFNDLWKYEVGTKRNGVCCFTGKDGQMMTCGPNVNAVNCMGSGANAFFIGFVSNCSAIDPSTLCSLTSNSLSLTADYVADNNSVLLAWQLPQEHQTKGFFIQRSRDGSGFKSIGYMPVKTSGSYDFTDVNPLLKGYYKVVWFEKQGFESNKVLAVAMEESDKLQLFPNPAAVGDNVRILLKDMQQYDTKVSVYNNSGIQVLMERLGKEKNPEIDVSILTSGLYYIRVEMNQKVYRAKLLKE